MFRKGGNKHSTGQLISELWDVGICTAAGYLSLRAMLLFGKRRYQCGEVRSVRLMFVIGKIHICWVELLIR